MINGAIEFNRPFMTGRELDYIAAAKFGNMLAGDGPFTRRCHKWIEDNTSCAKALLTHSCTSALDMAAILLDIKPDDEIIMPSYTFVSTANAFVLRGGIPVFVDIRDDTLNLDEKLIADAITPRTRAIAPVHYAGVGCAMDEIVQIARRHKLKIVEDAAQGVMAKYKGNALGSIGDLGAFSFHETKNVISGEGGALLVNDPELSLRAEIVREKGTDRSQFFRGEVDKYTWKDVGSSFLPGELVAAFLWAQLEQAHTITSQRMACWNRYHFGLEHLECAGLLRRPVIPEDCQHNAHMYYVLLAEDIDRNRVLEELKREQIGAVFHYIPLHSSPGGQRFGRQCGPMEVTDRVSEQLIRLPLWLDIGEGRQERVMSTLERIIKRNR